MPAILEQAEAHALISNIFNEKDHTVYLCADAGIEGGQHNPHAREIVSYEEFYTLLKDKYPLKKEKSPSPSFHKKRIPVPVRKKVDVVVNYRDGSKYSFKDVVYWSAGNLHLFVKVRDTVTGGINVSTATKIDKKYIEKVVIKEIGSKSYLTNLGVGPWYYYGGDMFCGNGGFSKEYK